MLQNLSYNSQYYSKLVKKQIILCTKHCISLRVILKHDCMTTQHTSLLYNDSVYHQNFLTEAKTCVLPLLKKVVYMSEAILQALDQFG